MQNGDYSKMKLLSLFSGIGAFEKALHKMNVDYELVNYCEIDKYASKSYAAIHNVSEELNLGDITKVDTSKLPNDIDLITYGFPCQDISLAGKQKGFENEDGSSTRSGLFFEALRIIEDKKPKVAIAENVKNLVSKKFAKEFGIVLESLENAGYNNYYKVLNAKHYGIPQNRERVFIVSIRKDIDNGSFEFPQDFELKLRLKDLLEENVDEKYYLSDSMVASITNWKAHQKPLEKVLGQNSICQTLTARGAGENHSGMVVYSDELEETTNVQGKLLIKNNTAKGYLEAEHGDGCYITNMDTKRGTVQKEMIPTLKTSPDKRMTIDNGNLIVEKGSSYTREFGSRGKLQDGEEVCDTLVAAMGTGGGNVPIVMAVDDTYKNREPRITDDVPSLRSERSGIKVMEIIREEPLEREGWHRNAKEVISPEGISRTLSTQSNNLATKIKEPSTLRIRKLTPKECWRLMGFEDADLEKAIASGISNTQLYKQAGNSIVVNVLEHLLENIIPIIKGA